MHVNVTTTTVLFGEGFHTNVQFHQYWIISIWMNSNWSRVNFRTRVTSLGQVLPARHNHYCSTFNVHTQQWSTPYQGSCWDKASGTSQLPFANNAFSTWLHFSPIFHSSLLSHFLLSLGSRIIYRLGLPCGSLGSQSSHYAYARTSGPGSLPRCLITSGYAALALGLYGAFIFGEGVAHGASNGLVMSGLPSKAPNVSHSNSTD